MVDDSTVDLVRRPPRLVAGDLVRIVSPASTPPRAALAGTVRYLEQMGLRVEVGEHALDEHGYLAGTDDHRLADFNDALHDPGVRAVIASRGGKGAYRIADRLDFTAIRNDPKLVIGFSEITILHLAIWKHARVPGVHGAPWGPDVGVDSQRSFLNAVFTADPVRIDRRTDEPTGALTTSGRTHGVLLGGNQDSFATAAGWALPELHGAILLLEAYNMQRGHIDRQLTMLNNAGHLAGVVGVAVGQYTDCGTDSSGTWTTIDVLRDRLGRLGVPILGGLPLGHGQRPLAIPVGTRAVLDADAGTLTVEPAVE